LNAELAIIDKRRERANVAEVLHIIGEVQGRTALIVDDMIDTAGTLTEVAQALLEGGASEVYACCTHAVFSGPAIERIERAPLKEVVVTNTIPLSPRGREVSKITCLSVAPLLGEAIRSIHEETSVSRLFI
jgi:ribose-phosphate pyrophosphokinase